MVVTVSIMVLRDVVPCSVISRHHASGDDYCFHLQGRLPRMHEVSSETLTSIHQTAQCGIPDDQIIFTCCMSYPGHYLLFDHVVNVW